MTSNQYSEFPSSRPTLHIPNWVLIVLFVAYALPGNIGHAPWRGDDVLHISVAYAILHEGHWLTPQLAGAPFTDWAPLTYWLGALTGKLFSPILASHDAIRMAMVVALGALIWLVRAASREIHNSEVASAAVLLTIGSLGLLVHAHEMQPQIVIATCVAGCIYGLARMRQFPRSGALIASVATGAAFLAGGLIALLLTLPLAACVTLTCPAYRTAEHRRALAQGGALFVVLLGAWPALLACYQPDYLAAWWAVQVFELTPHAAHFQNFKALLNLIGWFTWPLWPVAAWSLWSRRGRYVEFGHALPLTALLLALWVVLTTGPLRPANALPLLVPLILLAAPELCRLRRGAANAFDWFGVITFTLLGLFLWLAWTAQNFGWPVALSRNILRLMPGFHPSWWWLELAIALALSAAWLCALVKVPFFQLRGGVHWALGVTLAWGLATTLWLSWFDYDKNYAPFAARLAAEIRHQGGGCVAALEAGDAQRAGLYYFGGIVLDANAAQATRCPLLLGYAAGRRAEPDPGAGWQRVWQAQRGGGRFQERFALYRRAQP